VIAGPFRELLNDGTSIKEAITVFLQRWPKDDDGIERYWADTPALHQQQAQDLVIRTRQWFNAANQMITPLILHDRTFLYFTLRQVEAAIRKHQYRRPYTEQVPTVGLHTSGPFAPEPSIAQRRADIEIETRLEIAQREAAEAMDIAFDLIKSVPSPRHVVPPTPTSSPASAGTSFQPNTGFILMWLDRTRPELEDVSNTIKSACRAFGIRAFRADDVEHQDVITDIVLHYIRTSEFLMADLTGERPNVYYEIGYAHALGKRPILFRREGSHLHFDLSVHNVPEYKNVTELASLVRRRLEAMTGRKPGTSED
jgi:hypothetical protein